MKIQFLIDNPNSWMVTYCQNYITSLSSKNSDITLLFKASDVQSGDILILLSCERKFEQLDLNKHNLVVHESNLPEGRGWSPLTWQVIEGKREVPIVLFEASNEIDEGNIYNKSTIHLSGNELIEDLRKLQARETFKLIDEFLSDYPNNKGVAQKGASTYYSKRGPSDSELNLHDSIEESFNLLRVCDNEKYPAYFVRNGIKYTLKIDKNHE